MSAKTILTCAVTGGNAAVVAKHPDIPKTPAEIARASIEAAKAGAAIVHIHVREPHDGRPSNRPDLYAEVVARIRDSGTDVVINLTCGMDGDIAIVGYDPVMLAEGTSLIAPEARVRHAVDLRPEIATLDCGVMAFGEKIFVGRMSDLRAMATALRAAGVKPELECFEFGHIENAKRLIAEGLIEDPPLFQLCLGTGYGAPADGRVLAAMLSQLPEGANVAGFGCGVMEMPMVAQMVTSGCHVRVGLEDNIWLRKGVLASNADLVENAIGIVERLGGAMATPAEARVILGLRQP